MHAGTPSPRRSLATRVHPQHDTYPVERLPVSPNRPRHVSRGFRPYDLSRSRGRNDVASVQIMMAVRRWPENEGLPCVWLSRVSASTPKRSSSRRGEPRWRTGSRLSRLSPPPPPPRLWRWRADSRSLSMLSKLRSCGSSCFGYAPWPPSASIFPPAATNHQSSTRVPPENGPQSYARTVAHTAVSACFSQESAREAHAVGTASSLHRNRHREHTPG